LKPASLKKIETTHFELIEVKLCKQSVCVTHCRYSWTSFLL